MATLIETPISLDLAVCAVTQSASHRTMYVDMYTDTGKELQVTVTLTVALMMLIFTHKFFTVYDEWCRKQKYIHRTAILEVLVSC